MIDYQTPEVGLLASTKSEFSVELLPPLKGFCGGQLRPKSSSRFSETIIFEKLTIVKEVIIRGVVGLESEPGVPSY